MTDSRRPRKDASAGSNDLRLPHGGDKVIHGNAQPRAFRLCPWCPMHVFESRDEHDQLTITLRDVEHVSPWLEGLPSSSQKSRSSALSLAYATSAGNSGAHTAAMMRGMFRL